MRIVQVRSHPPFRSLACTRGRDGANETVAITVSEVGEVGDPRDASFATVLSAIPAGFEPDAIELIVSGYEALPFGIEDSPFPTVARVMDWNFVAASIVPLLGAFDSLLIDRAGVEAFRAMGHRGARYWPAWSQLDLREPPPRTSDRYDVLFIGRINGTFQRDRAQSLWRLGRLGRRHRVAIFSGVFGDDYLRALSSARIVFNRSAKGEANQRVFEAAACGALLFVERDNLETRDFFDDRVHCVYYGDDDLEQLVDYYLRHEGERRAIVARARARVREIDALLREVLGASDPLGLGVACGERPFAKLPTHRRLLWHARHALDAAETPQRFELAAHWLERARGTADDALVLGELGAATALRAFSGSDSTRVAGCIAALRLAHEAVRADPRDPLLWRNHGFLLAGLSRKEAALLCYRRAADALRRGGGDRTALCGTLVRVDDYLAQARCRLFVRHRRDGAALDAALRRLLMYDVLSELGELERQLGDSESAERAFREAVEIEPDLGPTRIKLADLLDERGRHSEGLAELERGLRSDPLYRESDWLRYLERTAVHAPHNLYELVDEMATVSDAISGLHEVAAVARALTARDLLLPKIVA